MKLVTKQIRLTEQRLRDLRFERTFCNTGSEEAESFDRLYADMEKHLDFLNETAPESVTRDTMPREVAVEMLCAGGLSNRLRKNCFDALGTHYRSVQTATPGVTKQARRFKTATLIQLDRWFRRAEFLAARCKRHALKCEGIKDEKKRAAAKNTFATLILAAEVTKALIREELNQREILTHAGLTRSVSQSSQPCGENPDEGATGLPVGMEVKESSACDPLQ